MEFIDKVHVGYVIASPLFSGWKYCASDRVCRCCWKFDDSSCWWTDVLAYAKVYKRKSWALRRCNSLALPVDSVLPVYKNLEGEITL